MDTNTKPKRASIHNDVEAGDRTKRNWAAEKKGLEQKHTDLKRQLDEQKAETKRYKHYKTSMQTELKSLDAGVAQSLPLSIFSDFPMPEEEEPGASGANNGAPAVVPPPPRRDP